MIFDSVIAIWFLAGAPSLLPLKWLSRNEPGTTEVLARQK